MAYDNTEVEIKIEVNYESFLRLREIMSQVATFKGTFHHEDRYFVCNDKGYLHTEKYPYKWLSIRRRNGLSIVNYKHYFPEGEKKHLYCQEYETVITDADALTAIFCSLGFRHLVTVDKTRAEYVFKDEFEVALDEVKGLGFFIEVEAIKDQGGAEVTRHKIERFIETFGLEGYRVDYRGYPFMLVTLSQERGMHEET